MSTHSQCFFYERWPVPILPFLCNFIPKVGKYVVLIGQVTPYTFRKIQKCTRVRESADMWWRRRNEKWCNKKVWKCKGAMWPRWRSNTNINYTCITILLSQLCTSAIDIGTFTSSHPPHCNFTFLYHCSFKSKRAGTYKSLKRTRAFWMHFISMWNMCSVIISFNDQLQCEK